MRLNRRVEFEAEAARQFALERYDILDTAEEYSFDHITNAVRAALDVPVAAISLVDGDRLWLKSKTGVRPSELPRNTTFCNHTIKDCDPMIVENALQDERFKDQPSVIGEPYTRSYIGVPLTTPDGHNIGALCAMDFVPRKFSPQKVELVKRLAELVIHELELRQQAEKDRLTGALSRSGFALEVQKAISLYDREKIKSTIIRFDVDLYKMVQHRANRPAGNDLLKSIIQPLIDMLRSSDCIGRMGGTQFAILLTRTTAAEALRATEALQQRIDAADADVFFDFSMSEISPGIGICDDWLQQVEAKLEAAKH